MIINQQNAKYLSEPGTFTFGFCLLELNQESQLFRVAGTDYDLEPGLNYVSSVDQPEELVAWYYSAINENDQDDSFIGVVSAPNLDDNVQLYQHSFRAGQAKIVALFYPEKLFKQGLIEKMSSHHKVPHFTNEEEFSDFCGSLNAKSSAHGNSFNLAQLFMIAIVVLFLILFNWSYLRAAFGS